MKDAASEYRKQRERCHFAWFRHSPDRLSLCELFVHLLLTSGVILAQITIDKWRVDASRRNAVAAGCCAICNLVQRNRSWRSPRLCWSNKGSEVRNVAYIRWGSASGGLNITANCFRILRFDVESTNFGSVRRELQCDCTTDTTTRASNHGALSIQSEIRSLADEFLSERYSSFPRNEIFLIVLLGFGANFTTGNPDHQVENAFTHRLDIRCSGDD
jgi:hypothetical protein